MRVWTEVKIQGEAFSVNPESDIHDETVNQGDITKASQNVI